MYVLELAMFVLLVVLAAELFSLKTRVKQVERENVENMGILADLRRKLNMPIADIDQIMEDLARE
jgi:hypothetical protein